MASRPSVPYEQKNRLFELAEDIESTDPAESRSFSQALAVVLDHVESQDTATVQGDVSQIIQQQGGDQNERQNRQFRQSGNDGLL